MRLNLDKVATMHHAVVDGHTVKFGWYDSGRAFIAMDGELMTYTEAFLRFYPKDTYSANNTIHQGTGRYGENLDGIVRYLREKYCM